MGEQINPRQADDESAAAAQPPPRRSATWPWLVMPLIALTAYFALRSCHGEVGRDDGGSTDRVPAHNGMVAGL